MKKGVDFIGVGVGAAIISRDRKLFITKRGRLAQNEVGKWEIPGGSVEFFEMLQTAAVREVKEEFGFDVAVVEQLDVTNHIIPSEKQHWVSPTYICKITKGKPKILEPEKFGEIGWFTLKEAELLDLSIVTRRDIELLKKKYPDGLPNLYA